MEADDFAFEVDMKPTGLGDKRWNLTWHDEFTDDSGDDWQLDPSTPHLASSLSSMDQVTVQDGRLYLLLLPRTPERPPIGARLNTRGYFEQGPGFVEFRAKLPRVSGAWPALWTMADPWPASGEFDLAESGIPSGGNIEAHYHSTHRDRLISNTKNDGEFHTFGLWRTGTGLSAWYFDGRRTGRVLAASTAPHWVCIDLCAWSIAEPMSPAHLEVSYVRAWTRA